MIMALGLHHASCWALWYVKHMQLFLTKRDSHDVVLIECGLWLVAAWLFDSNGCLGRTIQGELLASSLILAQLSACECNFQSCSPRRTLLILYCWDVFCGW